MIIVSRQTTSEQMSCFKITRDLFNQHKHYLPKYIDEMLTKYDKLIFEGLDRKDRHLVYSKSKDYVFEKAKNNVIDVYSKKINKIKTVGKKLNDVLLDSHYSADNKLQRDIKDIKILIEDQKLNSVPLNGQSYEYNKLQRDVNELKSLAEYQQETFTVLNKNIKNINDTLNDIDDKNDSVDIKVSGLNNLSYAVIFMNMSCILILGLKYMTDVEINKLELYNSC